MTKRNLFAELKNGMDALAAERGGKVTIQMTPFEAWKYLDNEETISAFIQEIFASGDEKLVDAGLAEVEKVAPPRPIVNKVEYDRAVMVLNALLDAGGADEKHRLAALANSLGEFISQYESAHGI